MAGTRKEKLETAESIAVEIVNSKEYRENLKVRAVAGLLAPAVETALWAYAYTKPTDHIEADVTTSTNYRDMTDEELAERHQKAIKGLVTQNVVRASARDVLDFAARVREKAAEAATPGKVLHFADLASLVDSKTG